MGTCFSSKVVSNAVTCPDLGCVEASTPSPSEVRRRLDPRQGVWELVPLWHRDLYFADLRSQLIILMGLNGPKCSQSLDTTHLEPAGGLA